MRYDKLLEPVSESAPCGPDLDEEGDDDYLNYVLPAEDRLPARFYDPDTGAAFDRGSIDLKAEVAKTSALLQKSRDLRLLALEARFQALAGQITGFCDCICALAGLLEHRWEDVHPRTPGGDQTLRQNILESLDDRTRIILPLHYAPILQDGRVGTISYRTYTVATGLAPPRENEPVPSSGAMMEALSQPAGQETAKGVHAAVVAARQALSAIRNAFISNAGYEFAPNYDGLDEALRQICEMIEANVAGLAPAAIEAAAQAGGAQEGGPEDGAAQDGGGAQAGGAPAAAPDGPPTAITSLAEAEAALARAEHYFQTTEPSAPALILVRQARVLIGQPLVVALEVLLPDSAESAVIRFEESLRFRLDMSRMRGLTKDAAASVSADPARENGTDGGAPGSGAGTAAPPVASRAQAWSLVAGVEAFFRAAEPSSPVPMLLRKAQSYSSHDFLSLIKDLIPAEGSVTPDV